MEILVVVHVLGWVFWLGTDVGVFLAAKTAERSDLGAEARLTVLQVGMLLDRAPRFAVPVVWGSGMLLSARIGYPLLPDLVVLGVTVFWAIITFGIIFGAPNGVFNRISMRLQTVVYVAVASLMGVMGVSMLAAGELPLWLALKWFSYVAIAIAAVLLDLKFAPVVAGFQELATEVATPELNHRISVALKPVYVMVLVIYAATVVAGVSGLVGAS